jgi:hypothetical protein
MTKTNEVSESVKASIRAAIGTGPSEAEVADGLAREKRRQQAYDQVMTGYADADLNHIAQQNQEIQSLLRQQAGLLREQLELGLAWREDHRRRGENIAYKVTAIYTSLGVLNFLVVLSFLIYFFRH